MIDVRAESIIYQSQIYYRDLLNDLVVKKRLGKALLDKWAKADLILGYLEALNYRTLLTNEEDILNVNYILECLIKLCELNQYPVAAPLTFQEAPAIIVGQPGATGATGATGPRGFTGLATDFSVISTSVTTVVDSFPITSAKAARWDYHVINTANAQRAASVIGHWTPDGALTDLVDSGADDLVGDTSGLEFNIVYTPTNIQLVAVITSGTWSITGSRYFIPNNGNGSGPITNVLPLGRIYIGNASNQAQDFTVTGDVLLSTSGVTTIQPNVIVDSQINSSANITLSKLASLNNNIVPITNGSGKLISSTLNPTTLGFVDIGSSLTGLLGAKLTDPMTSIGDIVIRNASNITTRLAAGTNNQVLTIVSGIPTWQDRPSGLATVVIDIGDWNMNVSAGGTASISVPHGLNYIKIRTINVLIRPDDDAPFPERYLPISGNSASTLEGTYRLNATTSVLLTINTGSFFDTNRFDKTSYNRGWVTISYVP